MEYLVIYTQGTTDGVETSLPEGLENVLECTEGDECCEEYEEHHSKWSGFLTQKQFDELVEYGCLRMQDVETLGSLTEYGWTPALSFSSVDEDRCVYHDAYVTPIPSFEVINREKDGVWMDRCWVRIREAMLSKYG